MVRVSVLQQAYLNQREPIVDQTKKEKRKFWRENYCICVIWMIIGVLLAGIPFSTILMLYIKDLSRYFY